MNKYTINVIGALVIIYTILAFCEIAVKNNIDIEISSQSEYMLSCIKDATENSFKRIKEDLKSFFYADLHNSSIIEITEEQIDILKSNIDKNDLTKFLRTYVQNNELIENAYVIIETTEEAILYSKDNSYNTEYKFKFDSSNDEEEVQVKILEKGLCDKNTFQLSYPIYNKTHVKIGTINFEVPYDNLKNYFAKMNFYMTDFVVLVNDKDNNIIYNNKNELLINNDSFDKRNQEEMKKYTFSTQIVENLLNIKVIPNINSIYKELYNLDENLLNIGIMGVMMIGMYFILLKSTFVNMCTVFSIIIVTVTVYTIIFKGAVTNINLSRENLISNLIRIYEMDSEENFLHKKNMLSRTTMLFMNEKNDSTIYSNILKQIMKVEDLTGIIFVNKEVEFAYPVIEKYNQANPDDKKETIIKGYYIDEVDGQLKEIVDDENSFNNNDNITTNIVDNVENYSSYEILNDKEYMRKIYEENYSENSNENNIAIYNDKTFVLTQNVPEVEAVVGIICEKTTLIQFLNKINEDQVNVFIDEVSESALNDETKEKINELLVKLGKEDNTNDVLGDNDKKYSLDNAIDENNYIIEDISANSQNNQKVQKNFFNYEYTNIFLGYISPGYTLFEKCTVSFDNAKFNSTITLFNIFLLAGISLIIISIYVTSVYRKKMEKNIKFEEKIEDRIIEIEKKLQMVEDEE